MSPSRRNEPIATWQDGDPVQGFALVVRREPRQDRNGKQYLDLELADASGSIQAKAWSDSAAAKAQFDAPGFVAFKGVVRRFRDQPQLNLEDCRLATDEDRRFGFDEAALVPTTPEDIDDLWRRLESAVASLSRPPLARLGRETLRRLEADLRRHPAAKSMHHAYRGGLLEHVVSMIELGDAVCRHYPGLLDRDLVLLGVLFHDLGKIREMGVTPGSDYTLEGQLVGHVVIGRDLLLEAVATIPDFPPLDRLHLEHLVLSHQGQREYGAPVEPASPEALALHFIDDLDSKMNQMRRLRSTGAALAWSKGLGRQVWFGQDVAERGAAPSPGASAGEAPDGPAALERGDVEQSGLLDDLPLFAAEPTPATEPD